MYFPDITISVTIISLFPQIFLLEIMCLLSINVIFHYGVNFVKQANDNLKLKLIKCSLVVKL